jgi:hypothetical protein
VGRPASTRAATHRCSRGAPEHAHAQLTAVGQDSAPHKSAARAQRATWEGQAGACCTYLHSSRWCAPEARSGRWQSQTPWRTRRSSEVRPLRACAGEQLHVRSCCVPLATHTREDRTFIAAEALTKAAHMPQSAWVLRAAARRRRAGHACRGATRPPPRAVHLRCGAGSRESGTPARANTYCRWVAEQRGRSSLRAANPHHRRSSRAQPAQRRRARRPIPARVRSSGGGQRHAVAAQAVRGKPAAWGSRGAITRHGLQSRLLEAAAGAKAGGESRLARRRRLAAACAYAASCASAAASHVTRVCLVSAQRSATHATACARDSFASITPSAAAQANAASSLRAVARPAHGRCAPGRVFACAAAERGAARAALVRGRRADSSVCMLRSRSGEGASRLQ